MNKTLKKICKYEKTILLCMILLFAMVVFQNFIFGNMLFVYNDVNDDTFQSYLAAYQLIVNMIKNGNLSLMNLTAGLGSNILSFQTVIFDPFAIILYIVGLIGGIESIPYALVYVQIIRMVCAGLACRYFLSAFPFSKFSRCVGAFLYAFSAFLLSDIGQHYMFSTAAVMIMLLLGLLEHSIRDNRILIPFSIFVAICSIWGIYMSYMILLTCGLYAIVRWIQLKDISIKSAIRFFGPLLFSVIFGMMLSGIILVPSTIYMLTISSRLESSMPFLEKLKLMFSCLDKEQYKTYILRLFSNQIQGSLNQWTGAATSFNSPHIFCSILLPVALIQFFLEKIRGWNKSENRVSIFVYILVLFICATQVGGFIFNAFVDYMTRFTFVLIPFEAYVITWFINAIMKKKIKYVWVNWLTGFLSIILVLKGCEWGQLASSVSAINAIICITLVILTLNMLYFKNSSLNVWAKCVIFLVLAANVSVEGRVSVGFDRLPITKEWYAQNGMNQDINQALNIANKEDSFFRFERSYLAWGIQQAGTYSEVAKYYGVSYYNSLVNKNIGKLRTDILKTAVDVAQVNYGSYSIGSLGMPLDNILADLYGLKYIISDYPTSNNAWKFEKNRR